MAASIASTSTAWTAIRSASSPLESRLHEVLRGGSRFGTAGFEHHSQQPAAEVGPHHPLARRGEQHLFDEVADVVVLIGDGGAATAVELPREVDVMSPPPGVVRPTAASAYRWAW